MCVEHRAELGDIPALASDKSKFLERFCKEGSNVALAIGDTNARPDFSPAERHDVAHFFELRNSHEYFVHFESQDNVAAGLEFEAFFGNCGPGNIAAKFFEFLSLPRGAVNFSA